jgi:CheY-like chemotaxis protein
MRTGEQRSGLDRRQQVSAGRRRHDDSRHRSSKTHFVANVSHEIRTPMQAILAMIDLLSETPLTQQQARYVDVFRDAGEYLLSLLNELLDYSRLESGGIHLNNRLFHLPQLVENVCDLMRPRLRDKNLVLHFEVEDTVWPWRNGDPQRLRQILVNLADNAIKFTNVGEIRIRLSPLCADRVLFEVTDTGAGIPELQQQQIFDAFVQGDAVQDLRGVGLGLTICKQLAKAMAGDIHVKSSMGIGSTFMCELLLPAVREPCIEKHFPARLSPQQPFSAPALSVLVADDSPLNCRVMEDMLSEPGSTVKCVSNGQDAVKSVLGKHYDLVLMDMRMPIMDGLTATRAIRYLENYFGSWLRGTNKTVIVALSASADPDEKRAALAAGCDDYLVKPLRKEELLQVLVNRARLEIVNNKLQGFIALVFVDIQSVSQTDPVAIGNLFF